MTEIDSHVIEITSGADRRKLCVVALPEVSIAAEYTFSVSLSLVYADSCTSGTIGIAYNMQNLSNYDFIHFRWVRYSNRSVECDAPLICLSNTTSHLDDIILIYSSELFAKHPQTTPVRTSTRWHLRPQHRTGQFRAVLRERLRHQRPASFPRLRARWLPDGERRQATSRPVLSNQRGRLVDDAGRRLAGRRGAGAAADRVPAQRPGGRGDPQRMLGQSPLETGRRQERWAIRHFRRRVTWRPHHAFGS